MYDNSYQQMPQQAGYAPGYAPPPGYHAQPGFAPVYGSGMAHPSAAPAPQQGNGHAHGPIVPKSGGDRFAPSTEYKDPFWAVFFLLHVAAIVGLAFYYYNQDQDKISGGTLPDNFWSMLSGAIGISLAVAAIWLVVIRNFAPQLVWFTCMLSVALTGALCVFMIYQGGQYPEASGAFYMYAVVLGILAAFQVLWLFWIQDRVAFAAVTLETTVEFVRAFPSTIAISFLFILVQAAWAFAWLVCAYSVMNRINNQVDNSGGPFGLAVFGLLVSLYWGGQVFKNVVHVTVAGSFGTWYFLPEHQMPSNPTSSALKRACSTSFGSICLGSLIVAVIEALKAILNRMRRHNNSFAAACGACLLGCLENIIRYINKYAYTYCALYGQSYCDAAKSTFELFESRGFDAVINDDLTGSVLMLATFIGGLVTGGLTYLLAISSATNSSSVALQWAGLGFAVGFVCCICAMEAVNSSITALFVCFAEDPAAFARSKPQIYSKFAAAWASRYGNDYISVILV